MDPRGWIDGDESAKEMLSRVLKERPFLLLPPLHRVPLRVGNVVEIVGPSPSAKSVILIQAAINCILPKEWNGVHFGGLERLVMYLDLDCRFDVLRLANSLRHRIMEAFGPPRCNYSGSNDASQKYDTTANQSCPFDNELFSACMRRFLYVRCYSSFEFLAALKTLRYQSQKESEALGVGIHFLMIDSIGAFFWIDRASQPLPQGENNKKSLSLQTVAETVVEEIRKLLQVQPMLVLATKATLFGVGTSTNEGQRAFGRRMEETTDLRISSRDPEKLLYREYMPSVWQLFVTHRILLRVSDGIIVDREQGTFPIYTSEWVRPPLNLLDKFTVRDAGIFMIS